MADHVNRNDNIDPDHRFSGSEHLPDRSWLVRNGPILLIFVALFAYLQAQGWDLYDYWNLFKAIAGLGFIIFVHELGHFAVAKWCDVEVTAFSIGFGPPIPGCVFQKGETRYMIAVIPLGGYVKMVGEGEEDEENPEADDNPRSFKNKPVGQRMWIISAGVIMNIIFGLLCFVFVYMTRGAQRMPAVIDIIDPGSVAWEIPLRSGSVIHQIGTEKSPYFNDLRSEVMTSREGEKLIFVYSEPETPEENWSRVEVEPRKDPDESRPLIGIAPPPMLKLLPKREQRSRELPVLYQSAAARAEPPFEFDDRIVATSDPEKVGTAEDAARPEFVTTLPIDPRDPEGKKYDYFAFRRRMIQLAGKKVIIRVERGDDARQVDITVPPAFRWRYGLRMQMGAVQAIRQPARKAGVQIGDRIEEVSVSTDEGRTIRWLLDPGNDTDAKVLDPERLPFELEQWALNNRQSREVTIRVRRDDEKELVAITIPWDDRWRFDHQRPIRAQSPQPIPGLGLAYAIKTTIAAVEPGSQAAKQGLKAGDIVTEIQYFVPEKNAADPPKPGRWRTLKENSWARVSSVISNDLDFHKIGIRVNGEEKAYILEGEEDRTWPVPERGFLLIPDYRLEKAENFGQALSMGIESTVGFIVQIYQVIYNLFTGRLAVDNLGGPGTIGAAAFSLAGENIYQFILFLGIISVNLAVVNFLPIPVLDGGHMVFLIYEKIRGKPASAEVRVAATYLGLAFIVCLMLFVLYLDWDRFFG
ncbi:MAG: metalloprotease [Gemmatales bacterium]|nr:MAG: metalloprotease [Gemmatales bacterium]